MHAHSQMVKRFTLQLALASLISSAIAQSVPVTQVLQCEKFSAISGGYYPVPPIPHFDGNTVQFLGNGDWIRYDSVNFTGATYDSVSFRNAGQGTNQPMRRAHLKLGSATGTDLVVFDMANGGWSQLQSKPLSTRLTGKQTLYLTFEGGDTVCWVADWLRFSGTASFTAADARTYFVAPYGSDASDGLTVNTPFRTIQRAASVMKPGSTCKIRQGVYRETVMPMYSGLPGAPMLFQAYNGEQVFISGADSLTGWTRHSGSIYKTTMPWSLGKYKNQLFVDGKSCVVARSPNIDDPWIAPDGWQKGMHIYNWVRYGKSGEIDPFLVPSRVFFWNATTATAGPGGVWNPNTIFAMELRDPAGVQRVMPNYLFEKPTDYYKGGLLTKQNHWWALLSEIKSSTCSGTDPRLLHVTYGKHINSPSIQGENSSGEGFISYLLQLLDSPNEWFRDSNGITYLWAPDGGDPSHHLVEAKRRILGFDLSNKDYVTLKGLRFIGTSATLYESHHCTIDDCHWKYATYFDSYDWWEEFAGENWFGSPYDPSNGFSGVFVGGEYNTVKNSSSIISAGSGFISSGRGHHHFTNNIIHDCNWLPTYAAGIRQYKRDASIMEDAGGNLYDYNTIYNCGRAAIELDYGGDHNIPGERTRVMHNNLGRTAWIGMECASIGAHGIARVEESYNILHSSAAAGWLGGDPSFGGFGFKVHHNLFYRGRPIPVDSNGMIWNNGSGNEDDHIMTCFSNTYVDSSKSSWITESYDKWLGDTTMFDPWYDANNLHGWSDTVKWMYTDPDHWDYTLRAGSPAIDAGRVLRDWLPQFPGRPSDDMFQSEPGTWDSYVGSAPDLGCYEYGKPAWRAGADWQEKRWVYPPTPAVNGVRPGGLDRKGIALARLRVGPRSLVVTIPTGTAARLMLFDMQGVLVVSRNLAHGGTALMPTTAMPSGIYVLRVVGKPGHLMQWKLCIRR